MIRTRGGYTLVEVTVAICMLGIVGLSLYQLRTTTRLAHWDIQRRQNVILAMTLEAEWLKAATEAELTAAPLLPFCPEAKAALPDRGRGLVRIKPLENDLLRLTLEATWVDPQGRDLRQEMTLYRLLPHHPKEGGP